MQVKEKRKTKSTFRIGYHPADVMCIQNIEGLANKSDYTGDGHSNNSGSVDQSENSEDLRHNCNEQLKGSELLKEDQDKIKGI